MKYLIDTNVISELRKGKRCHPRVANWFKTLEVNAFLQKKIQMRFNTS